MRLLKALWAAILATASNNPESTLLDDVIEDREIPDKLVADVFIKKKRRDENREYWRNQEHFEIGRQ